MPVDKVATKFHPKNSRVNQATLDAFIGAPLSSDLEKVPGIGPAAVTKLAQGDNDSVTNAYHLMGQFLALAPDVADPVHHCDRFLLWLETKDVPSHHSTVVLAMAEKANMVYPGVYDADAYK